MSIYWVIFKTTINEYFVYRLSFILWRFRMLLNLFIIYFFWSSIFEKKTLLFGYSESQMLTYILVSSVISSFVLGTRTIDIANQIISGDIINLILKPFSFFKYYLTRDAADKILNMSLAFVEIGFVILVFKPNILIQKNILVYFIFFLFIISGTLASFFISLTLSFIGFWTTEVWSPRFIYFILIFFLSGTYFPLDILPKPLYFMLSLTPFPYLYYLPAKIYLSGIGSYLIFPFFVSLIWVYLSYLIARLFWRKGLKSYSFFGR